MISLSSLTALLTLATSAAPVAPTFESSYGRAVSLAQNLHKPVAVFIGAGDAGFARVVSEGSLTTEAVQTLQAKYICLYVDTTTVEGQELAKKFKMEQGVILSDRDANLQALRHAGPIAAADLTNYVRTFAQPNLVINTTVQANVAATPAQDQAPTYSAPAGVYPGSIYTVPTFYPSYRPTSSCLNGRCPNAR